MAEAKTKILPSARRISEAQAKIGSPIISLLIHRSHKENRWRKNTEKRNTKEHNNLAKGMRKW